MKFQAGLFFIFSDLILLALSANIPKIEFFKIMGNYGKRFA